MKAKIVNALQEFSRAMSVPILILPLVGILIAIGNILTNKNLIAVLPIMNNPYTLGFGKILSSSLVSILVNLGFIFCVGIAIGMAKEKRAEAGFTGFLCFLIFVSSMNIFLSVTNKLVPVDQLRGSGQTMVLGLQIVDMGVFLGIILGIIVAIIHNKFINVEFKGAFDVYSGSRFVFLICIPVMIILAVLLTFIWPPIQHVIMGLGNFIQASGNFGIFLYGFLERILIPTGLHHLIYTPFLYSSIGGVQEIGGQVVEGARNIYFAEMADPAIKVLSKSVIYDARGLSKMFGLLGAALAMYRTTPKERRGEARAILLPAAITSLIAGVTEPLEFSFLFTAPLLFGMHAALTGVGMVFLNIFGSRAIGPNGIIDFVLYNIPLGIEKTRWPIFIAVGIVMFFVYYFVFKVLILKLNLKTPGRENKEFTLYNKSDYKNKTNSNDTTSESSKSNKKSGLKDENLQLIIDGLGGSENIDTVNNCFTRLRVVVKNEKLVKKEVLETTENKGIVQNGNNVQLIYGIGVDKLKKAVNQKLGREVE